ncbi:unnamed protein product [Linum trigynum]|uniref:Uncharacterized protein n=1 Tax=Linum trigynum TaxID=586398 RepID=A0AAV2F902_9ROSI
MNLYIRALAPSNFSDLRETEETLQHMKKNIEVIEQELHHLRKIKIFLPHNKRGRWRNKKLHIKRNCGAYRS